MSTIEIPQEIVRMNEYLARDYGYFEGTLPKYRLVWSDDQFEKRWVEHNIHGVELLYPEVQERPKYRQYIHHKWVLEVLIPTPPDVVTDRVLQMDYEPLWVFGENDLSPIPIYGAVKFVIAIRHNNMGKAESHVPEKDPRAEKDYLLRKKAELEEIKSFLFANETSVGDALAHKTGVFIPAKDVVN